MGSRGGHYRPERRDTRGFSECNENALYLYLGGHLEYSYAVIELYT